MPFAVLTALALLVAVVVLSAISLMVRRWL